MEASSKDAEKLNSMTQTIFNDSERSAEFAKQITKMDDNLSEVTKNLFSVLKGGTKNITNDELKLQVRKAREAHLAWMETLKKTIENEKLYPLQTNSTKCAFGHFYHTINVEHPSIKKDWDSIEEVHNKLHDYGQEATEAVRNNQIAKARDCYTEAERYSKKIFELLDKIDSEVALQSEKGIQLFH